MTSDCHEELDRLPIADSATIDVEEIVNGIVGKRGAYPHWASISPITTACKAPVILPNQSDHPAEKEKNGPAKPVSRVHVDGFSGVVFAYRSRGVEEVMTGLAAALVEYREDGTPGRVYKATELLRDEGWARLTSSMLTAESIERCDQEVEYFTYSPEGDVVGELKTPTRTPRFCEQIMLLGPSFTNPAR